MASSTNLFSLLHIRLSSNVATAAVDVIWTTSLKQAFRCNSFRLFFGCVFSTAYFFIRCCCRKECQKWNFRLVISGKIYTKTSKYSRSSRKKLFISSDFWSVESDHALKACIQNQYLSGLIKSSNMYKHTNTHTQNWIRVVIRSKNNQI